MERSKFVLSLFPHASRTLRVLINWNEYAWKGTTPCFQKIRGVYFTFCLSSKKIKICIYFKEVYSIKQIITVSALQTGQPASAGDPTYHVDVFIQQPITRSEQLTPTLGLCHGVFKDRFIFRHILGQFFLRKWNIHHAMNAVTVNKKVKH